MLALGVMVTRWEMSFCDCLARSVSLAGSVKPGAEDEHNESGTQESSAPRGGARYNRASSQLSSSSRGSVVNTPLNPQISLLLLVLSLSASLSCEHQPSLHSLAFLKL